MVDWKDPIHGLCINTLRTLSLDQVEKANSGHPGLPLGCAPMAHVLWHAHLRHDPQDPRWPDRDRFVLSAGHGSALLYSLLHTAGYGLTLDDLKNFRQLESKTPGHPETFATAGVECTTGPLGQGVGNGVGLAVAERILAARFNRPGHEVVNHFTYVLASDGDLLEGVASEAASLAGHLGLGKLIVLYDSNDVTLDGPASATFSEDMGKRFEAYGWQVLRVADGNTDLAGMDRAIAAAKAETTRPSIVVIKTILGYGSPNKQGTSGAHGAPLGAAETKLTKQALGWDPEKTFYVPAETLPVFDEARKKGAAAHADWTARFAAYAKAHPELAAEWVRWWSGALPQGWEAAIPSWKPGEKAATREASGVVINAIAPQMPWLIGGDADLSGSTKTTIKGSPNFHGKTGEGRNIRFGVREHAMAAMANGLAYHGGIRPFVSTFFIFSDYMRPSVRLAAMGGLSVIYVWTHDSIGVGEDGPTHEPIEHLMSFRAVPNLDVIRPADPNETAEAWRYAAAHPERPIALIFSRQGLPALDPAKTAPASGLARGAYVLKEADGGTPQAIIIATGSEVHPALEAQVMLAAAGVRARVVSMPCWELFERQDPAYRESVLPAAITARVSVEAGVTLGWERWTGTRGRTIGIDRYGVSAPGGVSLKKFGFTGENIARVVKEVL